MGAYAWLHAMCIFPLVLSQAHSVSSNLLVNSTRAMYRAPRGAPDGDVIRKAIEGKELDEEEQRRLHIMFQEMERRERPWPTTGEHCFRITMAGLTRGGAPQSADNRIRNDRLALAPFRIAMTGSRLRSRSPNGIPTPAPPDP